MSNLSKQELVDFITKYAVDKNNNYAIMIDGEWGSGKTYLVKNSIIPEINRELKRRKITFRLISSKFSFSIIRNKCIYISLYGVKSLEEIGNQLYISLVFYDNLIYRLLDNGILQLAKLSAQFFNKMESTDRKIKKVMRVISKIEFSVLCIDDIERCDMDINEILGYLNGIVEQKRVKMIIISNEKEINNFFNGENIEQKYMVATLNNNLNSNNKELNITKLKKDTDEIFKDNKKYFKIKEKLISSKLKFVPDINETLIELINMDFKTSKTRKIIENSRVEIVKIMNSRNCVNIRTLQFSFWKFEEIYCHLDRLDENQNSIKFLEDLLYFIIIVSIEYRSGEDIFILLSNNKCIYEKVGRYGNTLKYYLEKFDFIIDFIIDSKLDKKRLCEAYEIYLKDLIEKEKISLMKDDPINLLNNWNLYNDKQVCIYFEKLYSNLKNEEYTIEKFPKILMHASNLKSVGFNKPNIDNIINAMIKYINNHNYQNKINLSSFDLVAINKEASIFYRNYFDKITSIINEKKDSADLDVLNQILSKKNWGKEFSDYCSTNRDDFFEKKRFMISLDIDKIIDKIKLSSSFDITNFNNGIESIYSVGNLKDFYYEDLYSIHNLIDKLKIIFERDNEKTKKYALNNLILFLETVEENLKSNQKKII